MLLITEKVSNLSVNKLFQQALISIPRLKTKFRILLLFCLITSLSASTQNISDKKKVKPAGYSKIVSAGIFKTLPEFSQTHRFGAGFGFSWSKHRFGLQEKKPSKPVGFIVDGGIDHYFGKEEKINSYRYKYNSFTYIHTYAGMNYNVNKRGNINLTAGPALGIEGGFTTFFWGVNLSGAYFIKKRISLSPGILFMKDPESPDPLLSFLIKAGFTF